MSWMTDETKDTLKSVNLLRKLLNFAANLCAVEEMPILIGGTFRLTLDEAKQVGIAERVVGIAERVDVTGKVGFGMEIVSTNRSVQVNN